MNCHVSFQFNQFRSTIALSLMFAVTPMEIAMAHNHEDVTTNNKAIVRASFDRWKNGTGSPFELLVPEADWTIVGSSPLSKTYASRQEFLDQVIKPFNARMSKPLVPTVRGVYSDGDTVVTLFDAAATARDGKPYHNTYTWYFRMKQGKVVSVIAFFDTRDFDDFWTRVSGSDVQ
jgi:ketosteroid isomerase-like protein